VAFPFWGKDFDDGFEAYDARLLVECMRAGRVRSRGTSEVGSDARAKLQHDCIEHNLQTLVNANAN
jgi:hypothetical protein